MPKSKVLEPETQMANGWAYGYRPAPSTRTVIADPARFPNANELIRNALDRLGSGTAGFFEAEISDELTFAQLDKLNLNKPWADVFEQIAPYVISWNADAVNEDTGEWERLPAPAEAGPEVFRQVRTAVPLFLWLCLKLHLGGELPKELSSSDGMDDGADGVT
jgi:hypothetical protein